MTLDLAQRDTWARQAIHANGRGKTRNGPPGQHGAVCLDDPAFQACGHARVDASALIRHQKDKVNANR